MKYTRFYYFIAVLLITGMYGCDKNGIAEPAGGQLPTHYVMVMDSFFTPPILTVVSGSSVTFVNNTSANHSIMTDDSTTIRPISIAPGTSYFFKKDTSGTFPYHCTVHPNARGIIDITP